MNTTELKEITFVLTGYIIFSIIYYKLILWWIRNTNDKYKKVIRTYIGLMFAIPINFLILTILTIIYKIISGG